jgi:prepilin-type N-terminal cleavage/methylation domain-containing protein
MRFFKTFNKNTSSGFTLIELIAVVAILGIITFLAVGSYTNRSELARENAAYHEMSQIADAEKTVESDYGYYVPLTVLESEPSVPINVTGEDIIADKASFLIVDPQTGLNPTNGVQTIEGMLAYGGATVLSSRWLGPFMNYHNQTLPNGPNNGWLPLDPWGGPYHFLSITGDEIDEEGRVGGTGFSNYTIGHFAIVSWGRDSIAGSSDNMYYTF